jgi:polysaccharide deacetylase family protein (PEP-CTERM system associated)
VPNALTFDVEEWFHVCGVPALGRDAWDTLPSRVELTTRRALDLCARTGTRATFFVVGWVAERFPRLVEEIQSAGHHIGSHGHMHERAYDLGEAAFAADLRESVGALAQAGVRPTYFRAPEWSINERSLWALGVLAREGFEVDASMAPVRIVGDPGYLRSPHIRQTSSGPLVEMPPFVSDRFGQAMPVGWGWGLRSSSPPTVLRTIDQANQAGRPAVLTVHPWELDPDPPRVSLPPGLRFAHYFRLAGFETRLTAILRGTPFTALDTVVSSLRSPSLPVRA